MISYYCSPKNLTKAVALIQLVTGTLGAVFIGVTLILSLKDFHALTSHSGITNTSSSSSGISGLVFNEGQGGLNSVNTVLNTESVTYSAVVSPIFESEGGSTDSDVDVGSESLIGEATTEVNGFENNSSSDSDVLHELKKSFSTLYEQLALVLHLVVFSCTILNVVVAWELWKGASENNYWRCNVWIRYNGTSFAVSIFIVVGLFIIKILPLNIYTIAVILISWLVWGIVFAIVYVFMKDLHKTNMDLSTMRYSFQK